MLMPAFKLSPHRVRLAQKTLEGTIRTRDEPVSLIYDPAGAGERNLPALICSGSDDSRNTSTAQTHTATMKQLAMRHYYDHWTLRHLFDNALLQLPG